MQPHKYRTNIMRFWDFKKYYSKKKNPASNSLTGLIIYEITEEKRGKAEFLADESAWILFHFMIIRLIFGSAFVAGGCADNILAQETQSYVWQIMGEVFRY